MKRKIVSLAALLITSIGFASAQNITRPKHEITVVAFVPFEFEVGNRAFPSGTYVFEMATGSPKLTDQAGVLVVRNRERQLYAAVATGVAANQETHATPKLAFARYGEHVYLSKVWCQGSETGLSVYLPEGVDEVVESEALTLDGTMAGGI